MKTKSRTREQAAPATPKGRTRKAIVSTPPFSDGIRRGSRAAATAPPRRLEIVVAVRATVTVSDQSCPSARLGRREISTCPRPRFVKTATNSIAETIAAARPTSSASSARAATSQKTNPNDAVTAVVPMMYRPFRSSDSCSMARPRSIALAIGEGAFIRCGRSVSVASWPVDDRGHPYSHAVPESAETLRLEATRGFSRVLSPTELWRYRDLAFQIAARDVTVRYRQTALGAAWAVLQPVGFMVVFSLFFGRVAGISSDGIPYAVFSLAGLVAWTYFANALLLGSESLVNNSALVSKIYFPRIFMPAGVLAAGFVDLAISLVILFVVVFAAGLVP